MAKKQTDLPEELREAVFEAARAGAAEAYTQNTGYVNYFKAMETLCITTRSWRRLSPTKKRIATLSITQGARRFRQHNRQKGFIQHKTEAEIVEEMREEKQKQFKETKSGFESLTRAISLSRGIKNSL